MRALSILRATIALLGFAHGFPRELDARALCPVPLDHLCHCLDSHMGFPGSWMHERWAPFPWIICRTFACSG